MVIDPNLSYYKVSIKYKEIDDDSGKSLIEKLISSLSVLIMQMLNC